jgi:ABC-type amino acid transport substrate-binding protein
MGILQEGGWPGFEVSKSYFSYETYALALPRDDGAFRLVVDRTLAQLYRSGKINAILEKTFGKGQPPEMLKAMILINSLPDK